MSAPASVAQFGAQRCAAAPFSRDTPPAVQALFNARIAGRDQRRHPASPTRDLIEDRGSPSGVTGSLTWSKSGWQIGASPTISVRLHDTNFDANGKPYKLEGQVTFNPTPSIASRAACWMTRIRNGARNLFLDKQLPDYRRLSRHSGLCSTAPMAAIST